MEDEASARYENERRARIEAEARLGASAAAQAELEARLAEVEQEWVLAEQALRAQLGERSAELEAAKSAAETAGRAKTAFLANMSHEIRTPVSAVMGYANLIAATEQAHPETREWSQRLQRSAEHLLALLDDVLDLAKIDAGRLDLHLVSTEPTTVLEEVGVLMEPRAVERGLELTVAADTELPARIRTDPLRLRQILVNLVGNAVKYTASGKVSLRASARTFVEGAKAGTSELVLEVSDTGVGIAEADLERLFQPFEQVHAASGTIGPVRGKLRAGGVGLGLDIARRLARMLGGDIAVRSALGAGSTFTVTLPCDADPRGGTTPARLVTQSGVLRPEEAVHARLDGRVVLLVDDTEDNRRIVAHFLGQAGARVVEAASLEEAFERLEHLPEIELVLTDLQLPDGNGLDLVKALREQADRRPVVALTADAMVETRAAALSQGVDDFIVKPIVGHRLVARLGALFKRRDSRNELRPAGDSGETASRTLPTPPRPTLARPLTPLPAMPRPSPPSPAPMDAGRAVTASHVRPPQSSAPDVPAELLQKFYAVLAERVYAMEDAIRTKERVRLRDVAHRVAGSGSTMGHPELTELGRALESALGEGLAWEVLEPAALRFLKAAREAATRRPWM